LTALTVFAGSLLAWAIGEAAATPWDRPEGRTLALPTGLLLLAVHVVGVVDHVCGASAPTSVLVVGGVLLETGIAVRLWSIATLGRGFSTALGSAQLVTTGPYRLARHPSELGLLLAAFGGAIVLASPLAALAAVPLVPLAVVRCRREDAALARMHGVAYAAWATGVGWLGPDLGAIAANAVARARQSPRGSRSPAARPPG
jgi:protein-S-isoprenylcysteine O-methyltransferase Ste14